MGIIERIQSEPVLAHGLFLALVNLAVAFGLSLTDVQLAALNTALLATLSFLVRAQVTPIDRSLGG